MRFQSQIVKLGNDFQKKCSAGYRSNWTAKTEIAFFILLA